MRPVNPIGLNSASAAGEVLSRAGLRFANDGGQAANASPGRTMRVVHLLVKNFRAIRSLQWGLPAGAVCLVGPGDSGKTTLLEAVELAFFPRNWVQFVDSDFFEGCTKEAIEIEVTVVDVPSQHLTQDKFGLELRGWAPDGVIHDEPEDDDEPALTIRLRIDETLDPAWHVVSDRNREGRSISARDREALGVARIGDEVERQLSWARGSALAHATGDAHSINTALTEAHRIAREAASQADFPELSAAALKAGEWGVRYGAHLDLPLTVGVDPRQLNVGGGALSLRQSTGIPARASGLGSRRLLALAVQRHTAGSGVVTLVDEIEHGLEPHRLRHLLNELRTSGNQTLMTTHSETAVAELGSSGLGLVRRDEHGVVKIIHPDSALQGVIRALPEALLGKKVVVCEGATEWGVGLGLIRYWDQGQERPLARIGTIFVPGNGSQAAGRAAAFRKMEFPCVYWGDSDVPTNPSPAELQALGVEVIQWAGSLNTEQRIMSDVPESILPQLWEIAVQEKGEETVCSQLAAAIGIKGVHPMNWGEWCSRCSMEQLRSGLGTAAAKSGWYKNRSAGRQLGSLIAPILQQIPTTDLAATLKRLQSCAYGN